MNLRGLSGIDFAVMVLYFIVFLAIGFISSKRVKTAKDFTTAGQSLTVFMIAGSSIATAMGSSTLMGNYSLIKSYGMAGLTMALSFYVGWWILIAMTRKLRDSGATSIPGFLERRYNSRTRKYSSLFILLNSIANTAAQFLAFGTALYALGICSVGTGTIVGAVVIVAFTIFSGLYGVALTDTLQSVLLLIGTAILLPILAFKTAGGVGYVFSNTPAEMMQPISGAAPIVLIGYILSNMLVGASHCANSQRTFAAKDSATAFRGQLLGNILSIAAIAFAALPAFAMLIIYPEVTDPNTYTTLFILDYFPVVLKGLMMALVLGLLLTTGDTFLMLISSTIVDDVIRPKKPDIEDKKLLSISRWVMVVISVIVIMLAFYLNDVYGLFTLAASTYGAAIFFPLILGIFWKNVNENAVNIAMLSGGLMSFIWDLTLANSTGIRGVILGAALNGLISILGSLILNSREKMLKNI